MEIIVQTNCIFNKNKKRNLTVSLFLYHSIQISFFLTRRIKTKSILFLEFCNKFVSKVVYKLKHKMKKLILLKTRLKFFITFAFFFFSILKLGAQNLTAQQFVEDLEFLKKELPKKT